MREGHRNIGKRGHRKKTQGARTGRQSIRSTRSPHVRPVDCSCPACPRRHLEVVRERRVNVAKLSMMNSWPELVGMSCYVPRFSSATVSIGPALRSAKRPQRRNGQHGGHLDLRRLSPHVRSSALVRGTRIETLTETDVLARPAHNHMKVVEDDDSSIK